MLKPCARVPFDLKGVLQIGSITKMGGGQQNSLRDEKGPVPKWKGARGFRGMLPQQILKCRSSEIAENVYFAIRFCLFKAFMEVNQVM